ncbi:ParB/RepB/Spo0J family partition protein [Rhodovulum steppense]|uniref:ParB-like nuclease family protein n=1 Tax=Rhodovulum steppense TaxID=540251 RepID=A0A4R1YHW0_9RHOB|nr:ParB N-terminal domain-containing protein [Rhodovulum steppense]TCM75874.1 ParB-like nuclease family protein [Rhodovulum steppense]
MAKRRRLSPADPEIFGAGLETKAMRLAATYRRPPAPIAEVSGDAAARAALEEVAQELHSARAEGRFVMRLPLAAVEEAHLARDRIGMDEAELAVLIASLRERGQQMPVEVVDLGQGRYGLISGWRRLTALRRLHAETGADRFAHVQALVRSPEGAPAAYRAMVEENEIRSGLSFYERAHIALEAAEREVYPDKAAAVAALFATAPAPKRSKIMAFTAVVEALDDALRFPAAIPEHLGLALAGRLQAESGFRSRVAEALRKAAPDDAKAERAVLERALKGQGASKASAAGEEVVPGVALKVKRGRLTLSGAGVDAALAEDLRRWLGTRA